MSYNLFLDDQRIPDEAFCYDETKTLKFLSGVSNNDWVIVRNYDDFVKVIEEMGIPNKVSLDCDLTFEHMRHFMGETTQSGIYEWENFKTKCGIHCAKYLKEKLTQNIPIKIFVHSANPVGRTIIKQILKDYL